MRGSDAVGEAEDPEAVVNERVILAATLDIDSEEIAAAADVVEVTEGQHVHSPENARNKENYTMVTNSVFPGNTYLNIEAMRGIKIHFLLCIINGNFRLGNSIKHLCRAIFAASR